MHLTLNKPEPFESAALKNVSSVMVSTEQKSNSEILRRLNTAFKNRKKQLIWRIKL